MACYTIDTDADAQYVEGDYGEDLTCHSAARRMALSVLPDLVRDRMPAGDQGTFRAIVRDENGMEIYAATLTLVGEWKITPPSS